MAEITVTYDDDFDKWVVQHGTGARVTPTLMLSHDELAELRRLIDEATTEPDA